VYPLKRLFTSGFETVGAAGVFGLLVLFGLYEGVQQTVLSVELLWLSLEVVWLDAAATSLVFLAFVVVSGGLLLREVWTPPTNVSTRDDGPTLTAIVPVYRDGGVLHRSVESLKNADYANLEIVVACEPDDTETKAAAAELAGGPVSVVENQYPGSKSGAIRTVVEASTADSFAVFDADEIVDESFLSAGMGALHDEGHDVFQGRRIPEPTGLVEALAYCERVLFHASYKIVEPTGFQNCRSSSTLFTREAFEAVDGYDDLLTEDLAFAHKAFRHGLDVRQARNYTNLMEAPHTLADFWGQRKRWRIGQVEVLDATLRGRLTDGPRYRRALSLGRMTTSLMGSVLTVVVLAKWLVLVVADAALFYLLPIAAVAVVAMGVGLADSRAGSIDSLVPITLCAPFVYPVFGLLSIKSLLEYIVSWDGSWYHVEKTGS